jgi:hypothetical protein
MTYPSSGSADAAARTWAESRRSRLELAVFPAAVRIARLWTIDLLSASGPAHGPADADLIDSAVLAVSELVTNAIQAVSRAAAASQPPAAAVPGCTRAAQLPAGNALAGAAWPPEVAWPPGAAWPPEAARPAAAHAIAGAVGTVAGPVRTALPGRILSFGDLPHRTGLPGSARQFGPVMRTGSVRPSGSATPAGPARVSLVITRSRARVRIEVRDSSPVPLPPTCHRDAEDETGRGLTVVAALAQSWGWQPEASGKVVWCELADQDRSSSGP